jgi:hypothetical protein
MLRHLLLLVLVLPLPAAQVVVRSPADDGPGSLRRAVAGAGRGTIITFAPELAKQPIVLAREIAITASLMIDGGGAITISGGSKTRIFSITSPDEVVLRGLTLIDGNAAGQGAEGSGGAIRSGGGGLLRVDRCTLRGNAARGEGGGALWQGWRCRTVVTECTFTANDGRSDPTRTERGGGAIATASEGSLTVQRSHFTANLGSIGGAINSMLGELTVEDSTFTANDTTAGEPGHQGYGGAIYTDGASAKVDDDLGGRIMLRRCVFTDNRGAGQGGACFLFGYNPDAITLEHCLFRGNRLVRDTKGESLGGAIRAGNVVLTMTGCTFVDNVALDQGGALWTGEKLTGAIEHCTFTANRADDGAKSGLGGAIAFLHQGELALRHCTIADNVARGHAGGTFGGGTHITVTACILANNSALNPVTPSPQSEARCRDGGLNVIWPKGGGEPGRTIVADPVYGDPRLAPLADHGEPVPTRPPGVEVLTAGAFPPALKVAAEKAAKAAKEKDKRTKPPKAKPTPRPAAPVTPAPVPAP